jgi:predicted metal-dependent hydrolase
MGEYNAAITAIVDQFRGREFEPQYFAFFECFNQGLYFEAHDVLEELWLPRRNQPNGLFYKGLIQLAGAFVHLQKGRLRPANALFELARTNLERYRPFHDRLDVASVLDLIGNWRRKLEEGEFKVNPSNLQSQPKIMLSVPAQET